MRYVPGEPRICVTSLSRNPLPRLLGLELRSLNIASILANDRTAGLTNLIADQIGKKRCIGSANGRHCSILGHQVERELTTMMGPESRRREGTTPSVVNSIYLAVNDRISSSKTYGKGGGRADHLRECGWEAISSYREPVTASLDGK